LIGKKENNKMFGYIRSREKSRRWKESEILNLVEHHLGMMDYSLRSDRRVGDICEYLGIARGMRKKEAPDCPLKGQSGQG
jgi:hypothetical protein